MMTDNKTTKPKAILLISGGIDSPVAGFLAKEKGYSLQAIHFSQEPFTDNTPEIKSLKICKLLGIKELIVVEAGEALKEIADKTYREYYFILMKRFMMSVSEIIAKEKGCEYLVTGESIGQVSSQTISNLNTINQSTKMEIIRPLLFMHKQEIIDISTKNGYFDISKGPEMCDALASGSPKTRSSLETVATQEERCQIKELIAKAAKRVRIEDTSKKVELPNQIINLCK
jgi:thiamine biosynthesis protein ThiI